MMKHQPGQRNYKSSKDIYFLPVIDAVKLPRDNKRRKAGHFSGEKLRSIEQIMRNKSTVGLKLQSSVLQVQRSKKVNVCNLYDKYDYLPKIFSKNYGRRKAEKIKNSQFEQLEKQNLAVCEYRDGKQQKRGLADKQNSFNFDSCFYRVDFNRKLAFQIGKFQFSIRYSSSHKNMLLGKDITESQQPSKQTFKKKYTRLQTYQTENSKSTEQLQKVPSFLLKLLNYKKH